MPEPIGKEFLPPTLNTAATWENVADALRSADFEELVLPALLRQARWFGGKAHPLRNVRTLELLPAGESSAGRVALLEANYVDHPPEIYLLPLQIAPASETSAKPIARLSSADGESVLFDALDDERFRGALFEIVQQFRTGFLIQAERFGRTLAEQIVLVFVQTAREVRRDAPLQ